VSKVLERDWWSVLAAALGMSLIAALSLSRSYRTTLRLYKGDYKDRPAKRGDARLQGVGGLDPQRHGTRQTLAERRLPFVSEHASAIAVACFRSLLRSPEAKLML